MILDKLQEIQSKHETFDLSLDIHLAKYVIQLVSDMVTFSPRLKKTDENTIKMNKYIQDSFKYKTNTVPVSFSFKSSTSSTYTKDSILDLFLLLQNDIYQMTFAEFSKLEVQLQQELTVLDSFANENQKIGSRHVPEKERIEIFTKYFPDENILEDQWVQSGENNQEFLNRLHSTIIEKYDMDLHAKNIQDTRSVLSTFISSIESLHSILNNIGIYSYNIQGI